MKLVVDNTKDITKIPKKVTKYRNQARVNLKELVLSELDEVYDQALLAELDSLFYDNDRKAPANKKVACCVRDIRKLGYKKAMIFAKAANNLEVFFRALSYVKRKKVS